MRWKPKELPSYEEAVQNLSKPQKWFAWRPVKTEEGNKVWLEHVYRTMVNWEYITLFSGIERYFFVFPILFYKYYKNKEGRMRVISHKRYTYCEALSEFEYQVKEVLRNGNM